MAGMGATGVGKGALGHPVGQCRGVFRVEQVGVTCLLKHGEERRTLIGRQRRRRPFWIWDATNRREVVLDPIVRRRREPTMAFDAVFLENRVDIREDERRLLRVTRLVASRKQESSQ